MSSSMTCSCVISIMFRAPFYFVFHFCIYMLNLLDWISILDIFSYLLYDSTFFYYTFGEIHCQLFFIFLIQVFNLSFPWSLSCSLSLFHKCLPHFRHEMASLSENVTITFIKKDIFSAAFNISTFCNVSVFWFVLVHVFCVEVFLIWLRSFTTWFYLRPKG